MLIEGSPMSEGCVMPVGPITRARAKKLYDGSTTLAKPFMKDMHEDMVFKQETRRRRLNSKKNEEEEEGCGGIQHLPEDILLEILCRIPLTELVYVCKYVCKSWFDLVECGVHDPSFINSNSLYFESSFLISGRWPLQHRIVDLMKNSSSSVRFKTLPYGDPQQRRFRFNPQIFSTPDASKNGMIISTSDGVLLFMDANPDEVWFKRTNIDAAFYVTNPLTKQLLELPHIEHLAFGVISRIPETGKFKVITLVLDVNKSLVLYVLTVGPNMSWKALSKLTPRYNYTPVLNEYRQVSVNGVVYVKFPYKKDSIFHAVNLRKETMYSLKIPARCRTKKMERIRVSASSWIMLQIDHKYLGYAEVTKNADSVMDVWMLKNPRRSEWELMLSFNLPPYDDARYFIPRHWFSSSQVMVMEVACSDFCLAYFVREGELQIIEGLNFGSDHFIHKHTVFPLY